MTTMSDREVMLSVQGTARLANVSYTDDLADAESEAFQEMESLICSQVPQISI